MFDHSFSCICRQSVLGALALVSLFWTEAALPAVTDPFIEEIVVTARKREESLLEVPVAVTAFSAQAIRELNLVRLEDLARFTPGFAFDSGTGRQVSSYRPVVRGLTTIRNGIGNTSAATTFIDGVYVGGSVQATELYNLERVEILRGPQAAQYGRGTYAGAVNYVTRQPAEELGGEFSATLAEHDSLDVNAWLSGPLAGERLGVFAAAGHRQYAGEYRNLRSGELVGDESPTDLTARLTWTPGPDLRVSGRLGWQRSDDGHFAVSLQPRTLNNCCFRSADAPRAREYYIGVAPDPGPVNLYTDLLDAAGGAGVRIDRLLGTLNVDWSPGGGYQLEQPDGCDQRRHRAWL